jgi:hypothetical protein
MNYLLIKLFTGKGWKLSHPMPLKHHDKALHQSALIIYRSTTL